MPRSRKLYVWTPMRTPAIFESIGLATAPLERNLFWIMSWLRLRFRRSERIKHVAGSDHYILTPIQHICHRAVRHGGRELRVPQDCSFRRIERDEVADGIARKQQLAGRSQNAGRRKTFAVKWMRPTDLASLIIDRLQDSLRPHAAIASAVALRIFAGIGEVIHAVRLNGVYKE